MTDVSDYTQQKGNDTKSSYNLFAFTTFTFIVWNFVKV
jgi:hypothetical protein